MIKRRKSKRFAQLLRRMKYVWNQKKRALIPLVVPLVVPLAVPLVGPLVVPLVGPLVGPVRIRTQENVYQYG